MRAVIVASGPSARGFDPPDDVTVIAVNGAIDWIRRADIWFSLDASDVNVRRLLQRRLRDCQYHVGSFPTAKRFWPANSWDHYWHRIDSLGTYPEPLPQGTPEWWLWRLGAKRGICKEQGRIHTGNSAWGALGVAWHLGYHDVALIGVDANDEPRVEGGRSNNLSHLPLLFASALPDMKVVSCGALSSIPQMTFKDWYENR